VVTPDIEENPMSRRRNIIITASTVAILLGAGTTAWAGREDKENQADLRALSGAKVSLQQAVASAQQKTGGRAFDATIEDENGTPVYWVATIANGTVGQVRVDPMSGAVQVSPRTGHDEREHREDAALASGVKLDLAAAIQAVSGQVQGPIAEAGLDSENGLPVYHVAAAGNGGMLEFKVDPNTGNVTAAPKERDEDEED
jgi:uncharacterized membrane protein YkoI